MALLSRRSFVLAFKSCEKLSNNSQTFSFIPQPQTAPHFPCSTRPLRVYDRRDDLNFAFYLELLGERNKKVFIFCIYCASSFGSNRENYPRVDIDKRPAFPDVASNFQFSVFTISRGKKVTLIYREKMFVKKLPASTTFKYSKMKRIKILYR